MAVASTPSRASMRPNSSTSFSSSAVSISPSHSTLDQRLVLAEEQIVGVRPVDAADLVNVAKALGNEERGVSALALQDGIDGDGGAVEEQSGRFVVAARLRHPGIDPLDQALRPRQRLAEGQLAGALVEGRDIGEGAADVGGEPKARTVGCRWDALLHVPVGDDCTLRAPRTPRRGKGVRG